MLDEKTREQIKLFQKNEITEYHIYTKLARSIKDDKNREVLNGIAGDEKRHYDMWRTYSEADVAPDRLKIWWYFLISRIFGLTFGVKLMEKGEENAQVVYDGISSQIPEAKEIEEEENAHEKELLRMIDEEKLKYVGSMVLGLNDALVELTGALAGLTFALRNTRLVATAGLVTGIAASLSMAASEYLSTGSEEGDKDPLKASVYTGLAYVVTVAFLIFPFLVFSHLYMCLGISLFNAIVIIYVFTFYVSVAKELPFGKRFAEMASVSLGIALLSFLIGSVVRMWLGVE